MLDVKLETRYFLRFVRVVLGENLFENLCGFFPFKVLYVSNFSITKEENAPSLQEFSIIMINFQTFKYNRLLTHFSRVSHFYTP